MSGTFIGIYGHKRCVDCDEQFSQHEQPGSRCPRFSTPRTIRALWASYGNRPVRTCDCCVCSTHS